MIFNSPSATLSEIMVIIIYGTQYYINKFMFKIYMFIEEVYDDVLKLTTIENQLNKRNDEKLFKHYSKFSE